MGQPRRPIWRSPTATRREAAELLERTGMAARVERRFLDIAQVPDEVERADVVVLHRVVCCYPDYERLLTAAASKAGRLLVFSHPPDNLVTRAVFWVDNGMRRIKGDTFRAFVHPPAAMLNVRAPVGAARCLSMARVGLVRGRLRTVTGATSCRPRCSGVRSARRRRCLLSARGRCRRPPG